MLVCPIPVNNGINKKMPINDIIKPPILPAANGNQKPSFSAPIIKGKKPNIVETMVRNIGLILAFHALI